MNERTNGHRILVVDDEPSIVDAVATALRYEGFDVAEAANGRDALSRTMDFGPDLIVLDWMLPDVDGLEVGKRLRERGFKTAILFLTAKGGVDNKVEALRAGGDDYVTKPFSLAEIVARVQAILRRTNGDLPGDVLRFDDLVLDEARHEVFRGDQRIDLTATEFNLLRFFLLNPRRVLSKGQILQHVWRYDFGGNTNVVETYVSYLRRKLDASGPPLTAGTVRKPTRSPSEELELAGSESFGGYCGAGATGFPKVGMHVCPTTVSFSVRSCTQSPGMEPKSWPRSPPRPPPPGPPPFRPRPSPKSAFSTPGCTELRVLSIRS